MIIVYNPKDGAPITSFIFKGALIDPFYPDGYSLKEGKVSNGLMQYEDEVGESIVETYGFLEKKTIDQAQEIIERPAAKGFKCDFPGCGFETTVAVALSSHSRKHKKERENSEKPIVEPSLIPVAGGRKLVSVAEKEKIVDNVDKTVQDGTDADGVEWYGGGAQVENQASPQGFGAQRTPGKGHFQG